MQPILETSDRTYEFLEPNDWDTIDLFKRRLKKQRKSAGFISFVIQEIREILKADYCIWVYIDNIDSTRKNTKKSIRILDVNVAPHSSKDDIQVDTVPQWILEREILCRKTSGRCDIEISTCLITGEVHFS